MISCNSYFPSLIQTLLKSILKLYFKSKIIGYLIQVDYEPEQYTTGIYYCGAGLCPTGSNIAAVINTHGCELWIDSIITRENTLIFWYLLKYPLISMALTSCIKNKEFEIWVK